MHKRICRQAPSSRRRFRPSPEALEARFLLTDGSLDTSFGTGGWASSPFDRSTRRDPSLPRETPLAVQSDGKIVIAGGEPKIAEPLGSMSSGNTPILVVRLNPDGSPDLTFDSDSQLMISLNSKGSFRAAGVFIRPNGNILVAGSQGGDAVMAELRPDGQLESSFGSSGLDRLTLPNNSNFLATSAAIQNNGFVVFIGGEDIGNPNRDFVAARLNASGGLDTGFGNGGVATIAFDLIPKGKDTLAAVGAFPPMARSFWPVLQSLPNRHCL